jgi:hypothetical protein
MTAAHIDVRGDVETRVDVAAIEAWTAANERARNAYYLKPSACTWELFRREWR